MRHRYSRDNVDMFFYDRTTNEQLHPKQIDEIIRSSIGEGPWLEMFPKSEGYYLSWYGPHLATPGIQEQINKLHRQASEGPIMISTPKGIYKELRPHDRMTKKERETFDAYVAYYMAQADALQWIDEHYDVRSYRDNASFTGPSLSGHGKGSRKLVDAFYAGINEKIPGSTPVPIPPPESVHPKHDEVTQAFIFADYAVRKIAPIALEEGGLRTVASKLRNLPEIVDRLTAQAAAAAASYAANATASHDAYTAYVASRTARESAYAAAAAAASDNAYVHAAEAADNAAYTAAAAADAREAYTTWKAVNEMLKSL